MNNKINWQDPSTAIKKPRLFKLASWAGHICRVSFCLLFVILIFYWMILPQLQVNYYFAATSCKVVDRKLEPLSKITANPGYQPKFLVIYEINNKIYTNWAFDALNTIYTNPAAYPVIINTFKLNQYYRCWYNPKNPHTVVIKRGWDHMSIIFFGLTIVVFLVNLVAFYRWYRHRNNATK